MSSPTSDEGPWPAEMKSNADRGGCLRGCFVLGGITALILAVVLGAVAYLGYRFFRNASSTDPVVVNQWLQETVPCVIPAGYEAKLGVNFVIRIISIGPPNAKSADFEGLPDFTMMVVFDFPGVDLDGLRARLDETRNRQQAEEPAKDKVESTVTLSVGGRPTQGNRREWTAKGKRWLGYDVLLRPGVLFAATGPIHNFDRAAMDSFLESVALPTESGAPASTDPANPAATADPTVPISIEPDPTAPPADGPAAPPPGSGRRGPDGRSED